MSHAIGSTRVDSLPTHPVLRMLAPASSTVRLCGLSGSGRPWKAAVDASIAEMAADEVLLVLSGRGLRRAVLRLLVHRRWAWERTPSVRSLRRRLQDAGLDVVHIYAMWTSANEPRLALRSGDARTLHWFQRSGILADVGRFPMLRAISRSRVFALLGGSLSPAFAVLAERRPS
jgi:hypothetical protein